MAKFTEIFEDVTKQGTKIPTNLYLENGLYPIIDQGQSEIAGYTNQTEGLFTDIPAIIFGDHTRIIKYVDTPCFLGADGVKLLKAKDPTANYKYLYYALCNADIPNTGYNRHFKWLKEIEIAECSTEEQNSIVAQFEKIDTLICLRKQQLLKLDELVKSRFIEMFGDPVSNPFKWSTLTMKQASIRLSDGPFGSNLKSEHYTHEGVRVIRLGNIGCGYFNDEDQSYISQEHYETIKKYTCRSGEIVIATLGDPNLRACIIPDHIDYGVNKSDCVHYVPKAEILNNQFVCQYINCPETLSLASGMVHGQTRSRISSGQLADLPIYLPSMDLQQQFATLVEQIDKSKFEIQKSLEKLETLKKALMQKYFG